jgi:tRNA1Val (adenine37-N6)-methyltransferase
MKVTTDASLFGAWAADEVRNLESGIGNLSETNFSRKKKIETILDMGCGTGLLSLMLAQKCNADIDAIEIDEDAASQALENVEACHFKNKINIINADIRNYEVEKKYDIIISNPPFYENELKSDSSKKNTAHHSESLKLEELLWAIKNNLSNEGYFFLLLPYKRESEIRMLMEKSQANIIQILFVRQSVNHDYFRILLKGKINSHSNEEIIFDEISIKDEREQYTEEFAKLLQDYYLYL